MSLSASEAALYDRQIRLWGAGAQAKLQSSSCLIIGKSCLAAEAAKNVALAGIGHIGVCGITGGEASGNALFGGSQQALEDPFAGFVSGLSELNPFVKVEAFPLQSGDWEKLLQLLPKFDLIVAIEREVNLIFGQQKEDKNGESVAENNSLVSPLGPLSSLNAAVRLAGGRFLCGDISGGCGWFFSDLGDSYTYSLKDDKPPVSKRSIRKNANGAGSAAAAAAVSAVILDVDVEATKSSTGEPSAAAAVKPADSQAHDKGSDDDLEVVETETPSSSKWQKVSTGGDAVDSMSSTPGESRYSASFAPLSESLARSWGDVHKVHRRLPALFYAITGIQRGTFLSAAAVVLFAQSRGLPQAVAERVADVAADVSGMLDDVPVASVVGGVMGQEIIKVASRSGVPIDNWVSLLSGARFLPFCFSCVWLFVIELVAPFPSPFLPPPRLFLFTWCCFVVSVLTWIDAWIDGVWKFLFTSSDLARPGTIVHI